MMIKPWESLYNHNCLKCRKCPKDSMKVKECPCSNCEHNLVECAQKLNCKTWSRGFGL